MSHVAVRARTLEGGRKTSKGTGPEANSALHGKGLRRTHLDGELFGQYRPDRVTQAGQEAARSTQR